MTTPKRCRHTEFFKKSMTYPSVADSFLRNHLPDEIAQHLDWDSIEPYPIERIQYLCIECCDVAFTAQLAEDGYPVFIMVNHRMHMDSNTPQEIYDDIDRLGAHLQDEYQDSFPPIIIPIVIYNGKEPLEQPFEPSEDVDGHTRPLSDEVLH